MGHRWQFVLLRFVGAVASRVPRRLLWWCAGCLAWLITVARHQRVKIAIANIQSAFPQRERAFVFDVAQSSIRHLIQTAFEIPGLARSPQRTIEHAVTISNPELVAMLLREHQRVIFLSAHFGNWELGALSTALQIHSPFTIVGKPQRNELVNRYVNRMRERFGNRIVPMDGAVRNLIRALQENSSIAMLADQSGDPGDVFVPFFGRPAATSPTVAALILKINVPIVMGLTTRQADLSYSLTFFEVDRSGLTEYTSANVLELTRRHVHLLETLIARNPGQWLWVHRRWKHDARASVTHATTI